MKRHLFVELKRGLSDLKAGREGKLTLRTVKVAAFEIVEVTRNELNPLRGANKTSQAVDCSTSAASTAALAVKMLDVDR